MANDRNLATGRNLTYSVPLRGGQERLREMILYISKRCHNAPRFGSIKLNKILGRRTLRLSRSAACR
jgi:hypothetical protein